LIGGAVAGVLSSLPIIYLGNLCCCLWIIAGGVVAAYVMQQNQETPITPADGALVGLLAGIVGAVVALVVSIPIDILSAPLERAILERIRDMAGEMPSELRDAIDNMTNAREGGGGMIGLIVVRIASFFLSLFVGSAVSAVGGLLGAVIFSRPGAAGLSPDAPRQA
jgi:hypothetical protein